MADEISKEGSFPADADLAGREEWAVMQEATAFVVSRGTWAGTTTAQRKEADAKLAAARKAIDLLQAEGSLRPGEAELLRKEIDELEMEVHKGPPEDCEIDCYDMSYISPAQVSIQSLSQRLPLLISLAASGKVHRAVLDRVIPGIRAGLETLGDSSRLSELDEEQQLLAEQTRTEVARELDRLMEMAANPRSGPIAAGQGPALSERAEWGILSRTWDEAEKISAKPSMSHPFDPAGKDRLMKALNEEAPAALSALAAAGAISTAEADLLFLELAVLSACVAEYEPTMPAGEVWTCYATIPGPGRTAISLDRVTKRLPLVRRLIEEGGIQRPVAEKVLPRLDRDIRSLGSWWRRLRMSREQRKEAHRVCDETLRELRRFKSIVGETK